jgi:protein-disulfide isomerase
VLACAAHQQGKFAEVDALLWKAFDDRSGDTLFPADTLAAIAREAKLDRARLERDRQPCVERLTKQQLGLGKLGVRGTPTYFINGRPLIGARPVEHFKAVIDEELAKAKERLAADRSLTAAEVGLLDDAAALITSTAR